MNSIYSASQWMTGPQEQQMKEVFFRDSPIELSYLFHGTQTIKDNKILVFGPWAGPLQCITHIMHEMGHLAEIDDARILKPGWGLSTPEVYIPGRYSHIASVPMSVQPSLRECRAIAMQWHIQNFLGIEETPREAIASLKWMPDYCNIPARKYDGTCPGDYSYADHEETKLSFLENKMLEYARGKYTFSFFMEEWKRKNELLEKALKS